MGDGTEGVPILLLSPSAKPGGAERALVALASQLGAKGFEVGVVLLEHGPVERWFTDAGCRLDVMSAGRARQVHLTASALWRLRRLIRRTGARAVLSNMAKGHFYGGLAALASGVPAVWWQQGIPERTKFEVAAAMVPSAAVVCSCQKAVDAQKKLTPRRTVVRVHLGLDVQQVASRRGSGRDLRHRLGWDTNPLVGIVGRLEPWKGQDVFVRAAATVAQTHPDARFLVIGGAVLGWEGDYPERLERLADDLDLGGKIHFTGHQADVYPWFDALDVVVHTSRGEPFGLVLVEAMALAKPLVATRDGGPAEIVEDGVSGLLVPPGDASAVAREIRRLLEDPELATRLARGAAARASLFSDERMAANMAKTLNAVISDASSRRTLLAKR